MGVDQDLPGGGDDGVFRKRRLRRVRSAAVGDRCLRFIGGGLGQTNDGFGGEQIVAGGDFRSLHLVLRAHQQHLGHRHSGDHGAEGFPAGLPAVFIGDQLRDGALPVLAGGQDLKLTIGQGIGAAGQRAPGNGLAGGFLYPAYPGHLHHHGVPGGFVRVIVEIVLRAQDDPQGIQDLGDGPALRLADGHGPITNYAHQVQPVDPDLLHAAVAFGDDKIRALHRQTSLGQNLLDIRVVIRHQGGGDRAVADQICSLCRCCVGEYAKADSSHHRQRQNPVERAGQDLPQLFCMRHEYLLKWNKMKQKNYKMSSSAWGHYSMFSGPVKQKPVEGPIPNRDHSIFLAFYMSAW